MPKDCFLLFNNVFLTTSAVNVNSFPSQTRVRSFCVSMGYLEKFSFSAPEKEPDPLNGGC